MAKDNWPEQFARYSDKQAADYLRHRLEDIDHAMQQILDLWLSPEASAKVESLLKQYPQDLPSFDDLQCSIQRIIFTEERRRPQYDGPKRRRGDAGPIEIKEDEADVCPHCGFIHTRPEQGTTNFVDNKVTLTCFECHEDYFYKL